MKTEVLTVLYNMCSGHFSTRLKDIQECFLTEEGPLVQEAINELKREELVYTVLSRNDEGKFAGNQCYINWNNFKEEMLDQEAVEKRLKILEDRPPIFEHGDAVIDVSDTADYLKRGRFLHYSADRERAYIKHPFLKYPFDGCWHDTKNLRLIK